MRRICLVGFGGNFKWANDMPDDVEIWGLNEVHKNIIRWDRWFQIHPRNWHAESAAEKGWRTDEWGRAPGHELFLNSCGVPVYMRDVDPAIPTSVRYPFEAVTEAFGRDFTERGKRPYLTSTPAYMIALALLEGVDELLLSGINLAIDTEYWHQRPCFEYYLGIAKGRGVKITFPPFGCPLLDGPVYAVEEAPPMLDLQLHLVPAYDGAENGQLVGVVQNA